MENLRDHAAASNQASGLVGKMMMFLRNEIAEVQSAAGRLAETSDGLFGADAPEGAVTGSGATPSCAEAELIALMEQSAIARNQLHEEVSRLTNRL
ncbi:hypothetical protein [Roseobacter sp.]|uniref:hypothetical protein n=1 Tax=Roseobacter sp. TaxID=1907202 RepID=UPI0029668B40|nr:hypothetical protein [Roseobacter sp.]MDW3181755.1 hypothetical protein [Roseobacter sp.]